MDKKYTFLRVHQDTREILRVIQKTGESVDKTLERLIRIYSCEVVICR